MALRADERRDKLRKASGRSKYPLIRRYLNGETQLSKPQLSIRQSITYGREPGELKHLSSRRKRKTTRFPESRRAKWKEPKPACVHAGVTDCISHCERLRERFWESRPERVKAPYLKTGHRRQDPKYHETRETLWEVGGTTPQG